MPVKKTKKAKPSTRFPVKKKNATKRASADQLSLLRALCTRAEIAELIAQRVSRWSDEQLQQWRSGYKVARHQKATRRPIRRVWP